MLPTLPDLQRELVARGGLYKYIELAWPEIDSQAFVGGPHLQEICKHLEAVSRGDLTRLVIMVPPGCTKSRAACVMFPTWDWGPGGHPERRFMTLSFDGDLSRRDAMASKELIETPWYQERWGLKSRHAKPLALSESSTRQSSQSIYWTNHHGLRFSSSVGGKSTGWHANIQIVDDPTKPKDIQAGGEAASEALKKTLVWWKMTMATRKSDPKDFARIVIMQRLHEEDLAGICEKDGYTVLRLPMEYVPEQKCTTPYGGDWRTKAGELLCPERFDAAAVAELKRDLGPRHASAQLQQNPTPDSGAIFQRAWMLKKWRVLPAGGTWCQSWDCAFNDTKASDWVVGQVWYKCRGEFFLVDQFREQTGVPGTVQAIRDFRVKWPKSRRKIYIENKANGPAVEQTLRKEVPGIIMVDPEGSKVGRAHSVTGYWEAGNVYLPDEGMPGYEWVPEWKERHAKFPLVTNDDEIDAHTQAINQLEKDGADASAGRAEAAAVVLGGGAGKRKEITRKRKGA